MKVLPGDQGDTCYACRVSHRKPDPVLGEVWYEEEHHWLCLRCYLAERKFHGKGTVQKIFKKCNGCDSPESVPCLFCYDCSRFLCEECLQRPKGAAACVRHFCKMYIIYISRRTALKKTDLVAKTYAASIKSKSSNS